PAWAFLHFRKPSWKGAVGEDGAPTEIDAEPSPPQPAPEPAPEPEPQPAAEPDPVPAAAGPLASEGHEPEHRHMRWVYVLGAVVLVVLVVVGFAAFSAAKSNDVAHQKAQQLAQEFDNAGLTVPASEDEIVRTLGDDG